MNLTILAWQYDDGTCRFIYQLVGLSDMHIASCENYTGMTEMLRSSQAIKLDKSVDLYDYRRELYKEFLAERELNAHEVTLGQAE
jgi:hypothetical protein